MKKLKRFILLAIGISFAMLSGVTGCGGGGSGGDSSSTAETPDGSTAETPKLLDRTVYTNPTDCMLYSFSSGDGEEFTYFGRRDDSGLPSVITMLQYKDTDDNNYSIYYNEHGLPSIAADENGTTVEFEYNLTDPTSTASDQMFFAVNNDLTMIESMGVFVTMLGGGAGVPPGVPLEVQTQVQLDEPVVIDHDASMPQLRAQDPIHNVVVNVSACGEPISPTWVGVNFRRPGPFSKKIHFPTEESLHTPGRFVTSIPQLKPDSRPAEAEAVCTAFANSFSKVCSVIAPNKAVAATQLLAEAAFQRALCAQIAAEVGLVATPAGGAAAGATCMALLAGGTVACSYFAFGGPTPDHENILQEWCGQVEENLTSINSIMGEEKVYIQAWAQTAQGLKTSSPEEIEVSVSGPFDPLFIKVIDPMVAGLDISALPKIGEAYSATANFNCAFLATLKMDVSRNGSHLDGTPPKVSLKNTEKLTLDVPGWPHWSSGNIDTFVASIEPDPTFGLSGHSEVFKVPIRDVEVQKVEFQCPESIEGKIIGGEGTLLTLPLTSIDDRPYMNELDCNYSQDTVPLPGGGQFVVGLFITYDPQNSFCDQANEDGKYHVSYNLYGDHHLKVKSTLRNVEVGHFIKTTYEFDYQYSVDLLKGIIDSAVAAKMGVECAD